LQSPFAESVLNKGYEVFYLTDPIDQYCLQSLSDYQRRKFHNLANDHLELDASRSDRQKQRLANIYQPVLAWFKETFNDSINDAKISDRLVQTPMALLASQYGHDGTMERLGR
jgi:HSP90 family molecular chaperone